MVECPYCQNAAKLVTGEVIYPHRPDLYHKRFWQCAPCEAYVGCHGKSDMALGRLANKELRSAKMLAHKNFDPLWRNGGMSRTEAYRWLAKALDIPGEQCHIGMFNVKQCQAVLRAVYNRQTTGSS